MIRTIASVAAVAAVIVASAAGAQMEAVMKAPRFAPLAIEQLHPYQKPLAEQIMKVSSGHCRPVIRIASCAVAIVGDATSEEAGEGMSELGPG